MPRALMMGQPVVHHRENRRMGNQTEMAGVHLDVLCSRVSRIGAGLVEAQLPRSEGVTAAVDRRRRDDQRRPRMLVDLEQVQLGGVLETNFSHRPRPNGAKWSLSTMR